MKIFFTLFFAALSAQGIAQTVWVAGCVFDENKQPLRDGIVRIYSSNGLFVRENITDSGGHYLLKLWESGYYDLVVICDQYDSDTLKRIVAPGGVVVTVNCTVKRKAVQPQNNGKHHKRHWWLLGI